MPDTQSYWEATSPDRSGTPLEANLSCDVCVVGAGIAGLTTAYLLAKEGKSVVVLEAQPTLANGETAFTTAHLASVIDDRFQHLENVRGRDAAKLAYQAHAAAIDRIEAIVRAEAIDCDFVRLPGHLFPGTTDQAKTIEQEQAAAERCGVPVERIDEVPFPQFRVGPCLRFANQGQFHPLKYVAGVAAALRRLGGKICTGARVKLWQGGKTTQVTVLDGPTVYAGAVVLATNSPIQSGVIINTKIHAYTTYAFGAEVPRGNLPLGLYWDTEDPYHYIRLQRLEGGSPDRELLIVGGEDHKTGQADDHIDRWARLEAWTRIRFPDLGPVKFRWSGQVFETIDGLALIGRDPAGAENVYLATGDSGMGMTHGTIAGILLADLIQGRPNPWTELFAPSRLPLATAGDFLSENLNMAAQAKDWVTGGDVSRPEDVPAGQGALVRRGLTKIAVYRDEAGNLHEMSAVCTHMGCIVHWNGGEKTWDCPCHGSRFSAEGKVVHGPATADLKALVAEPVG